MNPRSDKAANSMASWPLASVFCAVLLCLLPSSLLGQGDQLQISVSDGQRELSLFGWSGAYYLIERSDDLESFALVHAEQGANRFLSIPEDDRSADQAFYRTRRGLLSSPLDTDGDGIDDVYEMTFPNRLNLIDPSDAALDPDGNGLSHLLEYENAAGAQTVDAPANDGLPTGGNVGLIAVDPKDSRRLYARISNDLYRSTDQGETWQFVRTSAGWQIAVHPVDSQIVYASTNDGIARSVDGGATWSSHLQAPGTTALAVHPSDPDIVYAMTHTSTFFVSLDGGESWNALGIVPTMASIETIAVDPFDPENIFAGSGWDGFYRSTDGGRSWTDRSEGLDDGGRRVRKVIADHSAEGILYIATSTHVFKSGDRGASWDVAGRALGNGLFDLAQSLSEPQTLFSIGSRGIYRSVDAGVNWSFVSRDVTERVTAGRLAIDPHDPERLYVGSSGEGLFWSENGGNSWHQASGFTAVAITSLRQDPADPRTLYAATSQTGIHRSMDFGEEWVAMNEGLDQNTRFSEVFVAGEDLYALTNYGLLKRPEGVNRWVNVDSNFELREINADIRAVAFDSSAPDTLYIGYVGSESRGVKKSVDGGRTWIDLSEGLPATNQVWWGVPAALAMDPNNANTLYVGLSQIGMFKTTNGGEHWQEMTNGIPPDHNLDFFSILIDSTDSNTVYARTGIGVFRTRDGGDQWVLLDRGLPLYILTLELNRAAPSNLLAGSLAAGFFRSTDGGDHWVRQRQARNDPEWIHALLSTPPTPTTPEATLFIGTGKGILRRTNLPDSLND